MSKLLECFRRGQIRSILNWLKAKKAPVKITGYTVIFSERKKGLITIPNGATTKEILDLLRKEEKEIREKR